MPMRRNKFKLIFWNNTDRQISLAFSLEEHDLDLAIAEGFTSITASFEQQLVTAALHKVASRRVVEDLNVLEWLPWIVTRNGQLIGCNPYCFETHEP